MTTKNENVTTLDTRTHVETPENVLLSFGVAGPGVRMGAYLFDTFFRAVILVAVGILVSMLTALALGDLSGGVLLLTIFFLEWGYGSFFEAFWNGRTPGKYILGLRVIKEGGYSISFFDAFLRNLLRAADGFCFYAVGFLVMFWSGKMQRLGDLVAGTIVVREQRRTLRGNLGALEAVEPISPTTLERHYVPSERTLSLIEKFYRRSGTVENPRTNEIAMILARPLAERLGYREENRDHLDRPVRFLFRMLRTFARASSPEVAKRKISRREVNVVPKEGM